jgi:universal stress protein E
MPQFDNILVGIDIAQLKPQDELTFSPPIEEAIRQGLWLARKTSAGLTFLSVLDASEHSPDWSGDADHAHIIGDLERVANDVLDRLVEQAQGQHIDVRRILRIGKGWVEIVRQVMEDDHDLVIAGTRDLVFNRVLFGSTGMKLLRKCPCAVWITKPPAGSNSAVRKIAVASDLKPVSTAALEAGLLIARLSGATVDVVNSVDFPLDRWWISTPMSKPSEEYHATIRANAAQGLQKQLSQLDVSGLQSAVQTHVVAGLLDPDIAILDFVNRHQIDLLAMGTIGRSGLAGMYTGNTAERLLPQLPCSVLAVKPPDFQCPIV